MTVLVTFLCEDGVVVAADSMITPNLGSIGVGHHNGRKVYILEEGQIFAHAGDHGQAARVRAKIAELKANELDYESALNYVLDITERSINQFASTGLSGEQIDVNGVLAFYWEGGFQGCVFEGMFQPRLLDADHFYAALGTGKLSADPFLRFLTDVFCRNGRPNVRQAIFLAAWVVQHVIDTNSGGIAGPIQISLLEKSGDGFVSRELDLDQEIQEHLQAIQSAEDALRSWRDSVQSGEAADDAPAQPNAPSAEPA
jgi:hypothetical protein